MGREVGTCVALTALQGLGSPRNWTMLVGLMSSQYPELARTKFEKNAQKKLVSLSLSLSRGRVHFRGVQIDQCCVWKGESGKGWGHDGSR